MSLQGHFTNTLRGKQLHIEINQPKHDQLVEEVTALATARNLCVTRAPLGQKHRRHWVVIKLQKSSRMSDVDKLLGYHVDITYRLTADETVNIMQTDITHRN